MSKTNQRPLNRETHITGCDVARQMGVYLSPRQVAAWECEIRALRERVKTLEAQTKGGTSR